MSGFGDARKKELEGLGTLLRQLKSMFGIIPDGARDAINRRIEAITKDQVNDNFNQFQ